MHRPPLHTPTRPALAAGLGLILSLLAWSAWQPFDRTTWWLEVIPVLIGLPLLIATWSRYPLSSLLYALLALHMAVLILGGAYSYARVPLGFALQDWLDLARNPYDRIGHFFQGLVPALLARELLQRGTYVRGRRMLAFVVVCIALAISACYELIEWAAALALGQGADEFLGTQGDSWDTQSDMAMALLGALCTVGILGRWQDRQLGLDPRPNNI
ncbi:putative membrane protein [Inhella inkyongensis]|uniref:Putative membrane protein n=1 Tax=Inhella inkyongensis TaxID=392593 RepID=A0A840SC07_9BURK|nr:DUF2238 domain-containing protein [Inhella inkyongensis]MBB5205869.1 putative membrane protein [Inhella inkyongensis]